MTDLNGFEKIGSWTTPGLYRGAVALPFDHSGRLLLQLRDDRDGVKARGKWGLFGGGLELGENPEIAVAREFEEETGLAYGVASFRPAYAVLTDPPDHGLLRVYSLKFVHSVVDIRAAEGSGFALCTQSQAERLDVIGYLRPVLSAFWSRLF